MCRVYLNFLCRKHISKYPQFSLNSVDFETKTVDTVTDIISTVDKLLEAKKQLDLSDVQDHMNEAVKNDFFNPSIDAALKR